MIKTKVACRLFSANQGFLKTFSDCSDWLNKSQPSKKATFGLIMKQSISHPAEQTLEREHLNTLAAM